MTLTRTWAEAGLPDSLRSETEAFGRHEQHQLTAELVATIRRSGLTRAVLSPAYGGLGMSLPEFVRVLASIAELDGSTAWLVMVWSQGNLILPRLTSGARARILGASEIPFLAATSAGEGTVGEYAGTLRATGRWNYLSGVCHAKWVLVHCTDLRTRRTVGVVLPSHALTIDHTWQVMGLAATESHSATVDGAVVGTDQLYALDRFDDAAVLTRHDGLPHRMAFGLHMAAVCIGLARGALHDLSDILGDCAPDHRTVELGELAGQLAMAEAALDHAAVRVWRDSPGSGWTEPGICGLARSLCQTAASLTQSAFGLAGSRANFTSERLQSRLRDVLAASSHANVGPRHARTLGEVLTGRGGAA